MKPVTDPALLEQLNAVPAGLKPVTDPALLSQLELPPNPTEGNTFAQNALIGAGKAVADVGRGFQQLGSKIGIGDPAAIQAEINESRRLDAPLMQTGGGVTGNVIGNIGMLAPAALVPGAGTYAGATALGGIQGALMPTAEGESRALNVGVGTAGGGLGRFVGDRAAQAFTNRLAQIRADIATRQGLNAPRDAALAAAQEAGAVVPPRMVQSQPMPAAILEGLAGRTKLEQQASNVNQEVWNKLGRKALGISDETPVTPELLKSIRAKAGDAYEALRGTGTITADKQYAGDLAKITAKFQGAAKDFPELAKNEIGEIVSSINKPSFSADAAIDAISILRDRASAAYAKGDKGLGKAYREASEAMENAMARSLEKRGMSEAVKGFQDARQLIAKTYSVEQALMGAGDISAEKLAGQLVKGKPLTDELRTIAEFARSFGKAAQTKAKVEPYSVTDAFAAAMLGAASGLPAAALPLARPVARTAILSGPYQRTMAQPSYNVGAVNEMIPAALNNPRLQQLLPQLFAAGAINYPGK